MEVFVTSLSRSEEMGKTQTRLNNSQLNNFWAHFDNQTAAGDIVSKVGNVRPTVPKQ